MVNLDEMIDRAGRNEAKVILQRSIQRSEEEEADKIAEEMQTLRTELRLSRSEVAEQRQINRANEQWTAAVASANVGNQGAQPVSTRIWELEFKSANSMAERAQDGEERAQSELRSHISRTSREYEGYLSREVVREELQQEHDLYSMVLDTEMRQESDLCSVTTRVEMAERDARAKDERREIQTLSREKDTARAELVEAKLLIDDATKENSSLMARFCILQETAERRLAEGTTSDRELVDRLSLLKQHLEKARVENEMIREKGERAEVDIDHQWQDRVHNMIMARDISELFERYDEICDFICKGNDDTILDAPPAKLEAEDLKRKLYTAEQLLEERQSQEERKAPAPSRPSQERQRRPTGSRNRPVPGAGVRSSSVSSGSDKQESENPSVRTPSNRRESRSERASRKKGAQKKRRSPRQESSESPPRDSRSAKEEDVDASAVSNVYGSGDTVARQCLHQCPTMERSRSKKLGRRIDVTA